MNQLPRTPAGSLRKQHASSSVRLEGWVNRRRDHGDLVFIDLRDRSGIAQIVFDARFLSSPEILERAKELRAEFVLEVVGEVVPRGEGAINPDLP
ncbi:MAG TPA: OB-fold nucleic acid binding domain-containing protein, partial [Thermoanaerobaculia bacterium]